MRKNRYYESMRGNLQNVPMGELAGFRMYNESILIQEKLGKDLPYPLMIEVFGGHLYETLQSLNNAKIDKFIYAFPSTSTTDDIALLYQLGYRICGVVDIQELLGDFCYKTCCKKGLIIRKGR